MFDLLRASAGFTIAFVAALGAMVVVAWLAVAAADRFGGS